jgi:hypothetical protein
MPVGFVTESAGILARRGAGKTYTAQVIAEELLAAKQQIVAIDPLNAWWGLRSGYKIVIFGGPKGDLPLQKDNGRVIADLIAENPGLSCVLSLRHLRKGQMRQFVTDFAEQLFHRKGETKLATPLHIFVDEADLFAPQKVMTNTAQMVGAMQDLVARGRQAGIGATMITQRPATLNKDVLTQVEVLIAGQITGPQDKKAIKEWIQENAEIQEQASFISSLAKLKTGRLWFWSPKFLDILTRVTVRKKQTFDSSATPKAGKKLRPMKAKPVDLDVVRETLAATIKEAEENDPRILRRKIADLERALKSSPKESTTVVEHAGFSKADVEKAVRTALASRDKTWGSRLDALTSVLESQADEAAGRFKKEIAQAVKSAKKVGKQKVQITPRSVVAETRTETKLHTVVTTGRGQGEPLKKSVRAVMTVLAQRDRPCKRSLAALQAGYSPKKSTFRNTLSIMRTRGFIQEEGKLISLTEAGREALGDYEPMPTGKALLDHWRMTLTKAPRALFTALENTHPTAVPRMYLADVTGYGVMTSTFRNAMSRLRTLELIMEEGRETVGLAPELFE